MKTYFSSAKKLSLITAMSPLLFGCSETDAERYPKLHAVPDRPKEIITTQEIHQEIKTLEENHDEKLMINNELRKRFGLEIATATEEMGQNKTS
ncbi:MAG: hypothetical protein F9K49_05280 [Caedimonadaceae bacterium]|nr:MAG: hypothetical protein F9K49_05280 [Caedimonadaceae bacterium]